MAFSQIVYVSANKTPRTICVISAKVHNCDRNSNEGWGVGGAFRKARRRPKPGRTTLLAGGRSSRREPSRAGLKAARISVARFPSPRTMGRRRPRRSLWRWPAVRNVTLLANLSDFLRQQGGEAGRTRTGSGGCHLSRLLRQIEFLRQQRLIGGGKWVGPQEITWVQGLPKLPGDLVFPEGRVKLSR